MNKCFKLFGLVLLVSARTSSEETCSSGPDGEKCNYVVNHSFCESSLPPEDLEGKNTLEEVHTYAELKNDPRSNLPDSFTICSTIMDTTCQSSWWPMFFNVLDNENKMLTSPALLTSLESRLAIYLPTGWSPSFFNKIPTTFTNRWIRSCLAFNSTSGSVTWMVEGVLIMSMESEKLKESSKLPKNLSRKLILGAKSYAGKWYSASNKVTNLNIFSSFLSVAEMKSMTQGKNCAEKGDYLAWENMEWVLHGKARRETVNTNEPCVGAPVANLFHASFPGWDSCMHLCENMGTRTPSVTSLEDWIHLKTFLREKRKSLKGMQIWLPLTDKENEGVWKDYNGTKIQNYTLPWPEIEPDGGENENCARVFDEKSWADKKCDWPEYACMCSYNPDSYLRLRGLCPSSAIDVFYKPMNDGANFKKLQLQGLKESSISYDDVKKIWSLKVAHTNVIATSKASHASYTLGRNNWTITGDYDCNAGEEHVTELKMSGCQDADFTCNDGQCVSMDERCNQLPACRDLSDEKNCHILVLEEGYNKRVPPFTTDKPVNVSISIDLLRIVAVNVFIIANKPKRPTTSGQVGIYFNIQCNSMLTEQQ